MASEESDGIGRAEALSDAETTPQLQCWQPYAYHEAGHAIAHWHHRRAFRYVTMHPRDPAFNGLVRGYGRPVHDRAGYIMAMDIAAAGDIAQRRYLPFYRPEDDAVLLRRFGRGAAGDPYMTHDMIEFTRMGGHLDELMLEADPGSPTGPETWLPVWRSTEDLITGELLWAAIMAVAEVLMYSPRRLSYREVAALAEAATQDLAA